MNNARVQPVLPPTISLELGVFALCAQDLPAHNSDELRLNYEHGVSIYPSREAQNQQLLGKPYGDEWQLHDDAVDWAYTVIQGETTEAISVYTIPIPATETAPATTCLHIRQATHVYRERGQDKALVTINRILPHDEDVLLSSLNTITTNPAHIHVLRESILEMPISRRLSILKKLTELNAQAKFLMYSNSGSQVIVQLVAQLLQKSVPPGVTNAELLDLCLAWGSRTLVFHCDMKITDVTYEFCFCYLKPLRFYPPIRVEFHKSLLTEGVHDEFLAKIMAHFILNPDSIY